VLSVRFLVNSTSHRVDCFLEDLNEIFEKIKALLGQYGNEEESVVFFFSNDFFTLEKSGQAKNAAP